MQRRSIVQNTTKLLWNTKKVFVYEMLKKKYGMPRNVVTKKLLWTSRCFKLEYQETVKEHQVNSIEFQEAILERQAFMKCQGASMQYKETFYIRRLFGNTKNLSCNTKKP